MANFNHPKENYDNIKRNLILKDYSFEELKKVILIDLKINENFELSKKIISYLNDCGSSLDSIIFDILIKKHYSFFEYVLLNFKINIATTDPNQRNILHYLSLGLSEENQNILDLINYKALLFKNDLGGKNCIYYAFMNNNKFLIKKLYPILPSLNKEEKLNILNIMAKKNTTIELSEIIEIINYLDITIEDIIKFRINNNSILTNCLNFNNFNFCYYLLKNGFFYYESYELVDLIIDNINNEKKIKILLNNGADVNKKNKYGDHPVFFLIKNKNLTVDYKLKIIEIFMSHNFNINTTDEIGNNLLHYGVMYKNEIEIINKIKSYGIIDNLNKDGKNSIDLEYDDEYRYKYLKSIRNRYL